MAKKVQQISIDDFLRDNLQATLREELGKRQIEKVEMPSSFATGLNPMMQLRPYQKEAFQYFFSYWENEFEGKPLQSQLLFHMATGSGKTLIMAGLMLYLYEKGYRNFLFFVNNGNVIEKTKDNFFNTASSKYLFNQSITINNKHIEIKQVDNFQDSDPDAINFCLKTTQSLHIDLNTPKENSISYDDFKDKNIVLISDEAHHGNSATKKGTGNTGKIFTESEMEDLEVSSDWETTAMRIFHANPANVYLEFTATEEFTNPNIAEKYKNKVIFDYSLKKFRQDRYSKDISVLQSDLTNPIDMAIQAVIMSQFRRKLGNKISQPIKPVILLKSNTIPSNKKFFNDFSYTIKNLSVSKIKDIRENAQGDLLSAFKFFETVNISFENLLLEIKEEFKEDNLLLIDGNNITAEKQQYLNSLEDTDNEYRAVFAVDMLNEGWDVLNLFDIVRLYNTRDAKKGVPGNTTNSEAQLIGRGARYLPFSDKKSSETEPDYAKRRKFDNQLDNPLRYLETLTYHSANNPKYIQELKTALASSGIIDSQNMEIKENLKESFKESRLYKKGYVFLNKPINNPKYRTSANIGLDILNATYTVRISTGETNSLSVLSDDDNSTSINVRSRNLKFKDFGNHVIRAALNKFDTFSFQKLHVILPNLKSIKEFIESSDYLADINVTVLGREKVLDNLSQKNKMYVAIEVLRVIEAHLKKESSEKIGSREFYPEDFSKVFKDHSYRVPSGGGYKEEGVSMKKTTDLLLRFDLSNEDWYAYDDNFGTSEEKFLIRYIDSIMPKLREKYCEIYLLRNYKDFKIYSFKDGKATEPDFVLFLRKKETESDYDNIQIFIEPKGEHLRKTDSWKEEFEMSIHKDAILSFKTANDQFEIWGMPFYTKSHEKTFNETFNHDFLEGVTWPKTENMLHLSDEIHWEQDNELSLAAEPLEIYGTNEIEENPIHLPLLIGCYKSPDHLDWILKNRLYNTRLGDRRGAVNKDKDLFEATKFLVLYNLKKPEEIRIFELSNPKELSYTEMKELSYPGPKKDSIYEVFEISPSFEAAYEYKKLVAEIISKKGHKKGAPVFIKEIQNSSSNEKS